MATHKGTSLRTAERIVVPGDTITDSTLIAREPNTPCFVGITGLAFVRCKFTRCAPPEDAQQIECTSNQDPLPQESPPEPQYTVDRAELAEIVEAARDGREMDVTDFCSRHGLELRTPPRTGVEDRT